jgi:hypothetical protein
MIDLYRADEALPLLERAAALRGRDAELSAALAKARSAARVN